MRSNCRSWRSKRGRTSAPRDGRSATGSMAELYLADFEPRHTGDDLHGESRVLLATVHWGIAPSRTLIRTVVMPCRNPSALHLGK
jgi:hypothetical protein